MPTYPLVAAVGLGSLYVGTEATVFYKVVDEFGEEVIAPTNEGVQESDVAGNYFVLGGIEVESDAKGRVLWSAEEGVDGTWIREVPFDLAYIQSQVLAVTSYAVSQNPLVNGAALSLRRGDTAVFEFTGLGDLTARTKLWFGVKRNPQEDADGESLVLIEETSGLLYLNGAAGTANQGEIDVAGVGVADVELAAAATAALPVGRFTYEIQMLTAEGVSTLTAGYFRVSPDVVRAVA
jgi:hypothetical protein